MKSNFKKLMSLVLSLVIMIQLIPVPAFAENEEVLPDTTDNTIAEVEINDESSQIATVSEPDNSVIYMYRMLDGQWESNPFANTGSGINTNTNVGNEMYVLFSTSSSSRENPITPNTTVTGNTASCIQLTERTEKGTGVYKLIFAGETTGIDATISFDGYSAKLVISGSITGNGNTGNGGTGNGSGEGNVELSSFLYTREQPSETTNWTPITREDCNWATTTLQAGEKLYIKLTENYDMANSSLVSSEHSKGTVIIEKEAAYFVLTGGDKNGYVSLSLSCNQYSDIFNLFVQGNIIPGDADSAFKNKTVKQALANSGIVTFDVTGALESGADNGFTYEGDGKISFDTTGKASGIYEAVADGKTYVVAVMPVISRSDEAANCYVSTELSWSLPAGKSDMYQNEIRISNGDGGKMGNSFERDMSGNYNPLYIYRVVNNNGVYSLGSMEDYTAIIQGGQEENFEVKHITVGGTDVIRIRINSGIPKSIPIVGSVAIYDSDGEFVELQVINAGPIESFSNKFFIVNDTEAAKIPAGSYTGVTAALSPKVGQEPYEYNVYIGKKSGDPVQYAFALYDDIRINDTTNSKEFKVTSSNNSRVKALSYIDKIGEENVIGIKLKVLDTSKEWKEEIKIEFNDTNGNLHILKLPVTCEQPVSLNEAYVSSVREFNDINRNNTGMFIYLSAGTYPMDVFRNKGNKIFAKKGDEGKVFITGKENGTGPIITLGSDDEGIKGIVLDGGGTRDGVHTNGFNLNAEGGTVIKNCVTGIKETGNMPKGFYVSGVTFENNVTAIEHSGKMLTITDSEFKKNTTAVKISSATYNMFNIKYNKFIDNTLALDISSDHDRLYIMQNYFEKDGASVSPKQAYTLAQGKTGKVYYSPFYTKYDFSELSADIEGAIQYPTASESEKNISVPVDRTTVETAVMDSALFTEMRKKAEENVDVTVEIPVKEITDKETNTSKNTAIWSFNNAEGNLAKVPEETVAIADNDVVYIPATTNLVVTDKPSEEAEKIVEEQIASGDVVQYVNFEHSGNLPGKATVKILKTDTVKKDSLKLYYIDTANNTVKEEEICSVTEETTSEGDTYYIVTVDHCSEYIISTAITLKEEPTPTQTPAPSTAPDSGSSGSTGSSGSAGGATAPTPAPTAKPDVTTEDTTEEDVNANEFVDAVEIQEKFDNASGAQVTIDAGEKSLISSKAFEILEKSEDKELVIEGDGYSWNFKAEDITDAGAVNSTTFNPAISLESPNAEEIEKLTEGAQAINIYFAQQGKLPGKAGISVDVGSEYAGKTMYMYAYNSVKNVMEIVGEVVIDPQGKAVFETDKGGDFVLSPVELANAVNAEDEKQDVATQPDVQPTPDKENFSMGIIPFVVAIAAAAVVAIALASKKKKSE